jgi:hypothetical protein
VANTVRVGSKVDLSDAYHHLALHPQLRKFFTFQIDGEFFTCVAIPFGWSLAPYAYTKFTRPIITALRSPGVPQTHGYPGMLGSRGWRADDYFVQIYIDDILLLSTRKERQARVVEALLELLQNLGILYHPTKCVLTPEPFLEFLGFKLDIANQRFLLTEK